MKLYINKNNQQVGPYSQEEARELIYRGDVTRSAMACVEGTDNWVPIDSLLTPPKTVSSVPPPIAISIEKLRDPKEKTALLWLYIASIPAWLFLVAFTVGSFGIPLLVIGFLTLMVFIGEMWFAAYVKTNAVRVSENQLPELHRAVQACCKQLNMLCPDVYLMQANIWNAFATKIWGRRMVVLFSGAVDSILLKGDLQQLTFVVGHELGHHRAGHLDFSRKLANLGDWLVWVKLWYSRRAELTCDRMGLYCTGSLRSSQLALLNATVGAQLAAQVNAEAAVDQWRRCRSEFFVQYRTLYSTHPHLLARLDLLTQAAAELGLAAN